MANPSNPANVPRDGACVRLTDGRIGRVRGRTGEVRSSKYASGVTRAIRTSS
jgi:hypothetical protein